MMLELEQESERVPLLHRLVQKTRTGEVSIDTYLRKCWGDESTLNSWPLL